MSSPFTVGTLRNHLQRVRRDFPYIVPFLDKYFGDDRVLMIAQRASIGIMLTLTDGKQHSDVVPQQPVFFHISTLPVGPDQARDWFVRNYGGYTKFMYKTWGSEKFRQTGCSIWCHVVYGVVEKGIWVNMSICPVTEQALNLVYGMFIPPEFLTPEEIRLLDQGPRKVAYLLIMKQGVKPVNEVWYVQQVVQAVVPEALTSPGAQIKAKWETGPIDEARAIYASLVAFGKDVADASKYKLETKSFSDADGDKGIVSIVFHKQI